MKWKPATQALLRWVATGIAVGLCAITAIAQTESAVASATGDQALRDAILKRFAASRIGARNFQVAVSNGIVTLTGNTDIAQHKGTATRLAKSAGAKEVLNEIEISDAGKQRMRRSLDGARKPLASDMPELPEAQRQGTLSGTGHPQASAASSVEAEADAEQPTLGETGSGATPTFKVMPPAKRGAARGGRRRY